MLEVSTILHANMDEHTVMEYLREKHTEFSLLSRNEILESLLSKEYVEIEYLKGLVFKKRLEYFLLAKCLREKMLFETRYKQLKRYLVDEVRMENEEAKETAKKYNKACRTFDSFAIIVRNDASFPTKVR